ncbi:hypothetical protein C5F59_034850 [Streptomyces sp. QL37]|uniref:hypothetical protein n=1 Tax=Streptomyces sp. QL37 TaxID=2093747 RepID=UPI000CF2F6F1|nr:hypothetical protein [Streptomyces sp. QL37]PPQ61365.1 hypothetical protein C5F59_35340 [Streptomyces sp. QL37]
MLIVIVPVRYAVGDALADDRLRQELTVTAESVNPLAVTKEQPAERGHRSVPPVEAEVICSDRDEHRHRVTSRSVDIPCPTPPDRQQVRGSGHRSRRPHSSATSPPTGSGRPEA